MMNIDTDALQELNRTLIAPGTYIDGIIRATGDVAIAGEGSGEVVTTGKLTILSSFKGNITANSLQMTGANLEGDVSVSETLSIDQNSVLKGNGTASSLKCAGKIEGDMKVANDAILGETSVVKGDMATLFLQVKQGARINGKINTGRISGNVSEQ